MPRPRINWAPEMRAENTDSVASRVRRQFPAAAIRSRAELRDEMCKCGATVIPHGFERGPVRCSACRAAAVERVYAESERMPL